MPIWLRKAFEKHLGHELDERTMGHDQLPLAVEARLQHVKELADSAPNITGTFPIRKSHGVEGFSLRNAPSVRFRLWAQLKDADVNLHQQRLYHDRRCQVLGVDLGCLSRPTHGRAEDHVEGVELCSMLPDHPSPTVGQTEQVLVLEPRALDAIDVVL